MRALAKGFDSFLGSVVCPRCRRCATARFGGGGARGDGWLMPAFQVSARAIACTHCGYSAKRPDEPGARLPFELWLKTEYRGRLIWAYSVEHVRGIERFLASGGTLDAEPGHPASLSRLSGLPAWMYHNRDGVLKCLARLCEMGLDSEPKSGVPAGVS